MLNRRIAVVTIAASLFSTMISTDAHAGPFQPGDVITYTQTEWGDPSHTAGMLLNSQYDFVYASSGGLLEVGVPGTAGFSILFTSASGLLDYLPAQGAIGPLNADLVDPTFSSAGGFGGEVTDLQVNVDFSDAGRTLGTLGIRLGDLVIHDYGSLPQVNGLTVRQFLGDLNVLLGGGTVGYTVGDAFTLAEQLNVSFDGGTPTQFAQAHLQSAPAPVPEPATLTLLGIGVAAVTMRRARLADELP